MENNTKFIIPLVALAIIFVAACDGSPARDKLPDNASVSEGACKRADDWDKQTQFRVGHAYYCGKEGFEENTQIGKCIIIKAVNNKHRKAASMLVNIELAQSKGKICKS